ncbi:hypothetical protein [Mariniblastus fucicola]|uniref:Uncharacterized protein n=1 Tax=Mariniblastus fucicola TaxID=980251 RepID=A0A5B9P1Z2_9BACT|nr:hypothetical protein [Mariniblastus fucicola]QEG20527.1 hypothetical protein MFFC18_03760 [Mariniblastus fucicola]
MFSGLLCAQNGSQSEAVKQAQQRQAKMMQTQFFMQQLMQLNFNSELRKELH